MPPEFLLYGPARCVLVLALLPEHDTLRQCCSTPDSLDSPVHRWVNLGERLAVVHPAQLADYSTSCRSCTPPFPLDLMSVITTAGLEVVKVVQTSGTGDGLAHLADLRDATGIRRLNLLRFIQKQGCMFRRRFHFAGRRWALGCAP
jgi:hypothetical protein